MEIEPATLYFDGLRSVYYKTGQYEKLIPLAEKQLAFNDGPVKQFYLAKAFLINGQSQRAIKRIKESLMDYPETIPLISNLIQAYILEGKLDEAKAICEEIILINPDLRSDFSLTLEAIAFMESQDLNPEFLSRFEGFFRFPQQELIQEYRIRNGLIYSKTLNQIGFYRYPAGKNSLKTGSWYGGREMNLLYNEQGGVYGIRKTETQGQRKSKFYLWKQDSTIWQAEDLLRSEQYAQAQIAYQKAIEQHPEHFYLYQAQQHLTYLEFQAETDIQRNFQRLVGQYGEVEIWIENDLLYYKRPGVARRILRPLTDKRFTTLLAYKYNYEFVEQNGQIVGIQVYDYNAEKKEWEKAEDGYFERTKLAD